MLGKFRLAYTCATGVYAINGMISIAFAAIFMERTATEKLTALILAEPKLQILLASGVLTLISAAVGFFALVNSIERRKTLHVYGWTILVVIILQIIVACIAWLDTLTMRAFVERNWLVELTPVDVSDFQEKFRCCGFVNATDKAVVSPMCPAGASATSTIQGCKEPVSSGAQGLLQNFYTAIFAALFADVSAFLACAIAAQYRQEEARFKKIDAKNLSGPSKLRIAI